MDEYKTALKENIWKLYIMSGVRGALIHVAVLVIFLQSEGITLQDVFFLQASWSLLQVILEIPSGYLSDRWGRKPTIIFGSICKFLGAFIFCISGNFWGFLLAISLLSIGSSFYSGTMEAITYDTLLELDEAKKYRKIAGKQAFFQFSTEAVASIIGGLIALVSLRATWWGTLLFFSIGPLVAITLQEPRRHKLQEERHLNAIWNICKTSFLHNKSIRNVILLHNIIITMAFTLYWLTQPFQNMVNLPLALFGIVHAAIVITHAISSRYTHALEKYIDDRLFLMLISITIVGSFLIIGSFAALWTIALFLIVRMVWGFTSTLTSDLINRMTTSDIRATVLSLRAMGFRLMFMIAGPFIGYLADIYTINQAILIAGIIGGVALIVTFVLMRGVWKEIPQ